MALVSCPKCGKKISSKYLQCPHCQFVLNEEDLSDEDKDKLAYRARRDAALNIQNQASLALLVLVAGIILYYLEGTSFTQAPGTISSIVLSLGAIWYLAIRFYVFHKNMHRKTNFFKKN